MMTVHFIENMSDGREKCLVSALRTLKALVWLPGGSPERSGRNTVENIIWDISSAT